MRHGIIQRTWLGELAKSLAQLGWPYASERRPWAAHLDALHELDMVLDMALRAPGSVSMMNAIATRSEGNGGEAAPDILELPQNRGDLELYCEEFGIRTIGWIVAALDAPDGALVPGEGNDVVVARLALRSLSSLTVSYAFGSFEKDIVIDALYGADVRERLDRLALRILELPQLAWWSEEFDSAHYAVHSVTEWAGVSVAEPGKPLAPELLRQRGIGWLSKEDRQVTARFRAADKEFRDLARAFGTSWAPQSQIFGQVSASYRSTNPKWFVPSREELRIGLGQLARERENSIEERYVDELARNHSAVCTKQFLGDDAGDRPLRALVQQKLPAGECRLWTIHSSRDWADLVIRFPLLLVPSGGADGPETWSGDARGAWVTVDWKRAAQEYDGIYLSVLGTLDATYVPLRVAIPGPHGDRECWTIMTGWVPGSILWLTDPFTSWPEIPEWSFDDVQHEYEEALARLKAE